MPAGAASPEELEGMLEDTHRSMQSGPLALIISEAAISVAQRNLEGLHYVISRLDL